MRVQITLACSECKSRTYRTTKNKQKHTERLEVSKFCPRCGRHTSHKEVR